MVIAHHTLAQFSKQTFDTNINRSLNNYCITRLHIHNLQSIEIETWYQHHE